MTPLLTPRDARRPSTEVGRGHFLLRRSSIDTGTPYFFHPTVKRRTSPNPSCRRGIDRTATELTILPLQGELEGVSIPRKKRTQSRGKRGPNPEGKKDTIPGEKRTISRGKRGPNPEGKEDPITGEKRTLSRRKGGHPEESEEKLTNQCLPRTQLIRPYATLPSGQDSHQSPECFPKLIPDD